MHSQSSKTWRKKEKSSKKEERARGVTKLSVAVGFQAVLQRVEEKLLPWKVKGGKGLGGRSAGGGSPVMPVGVAGAQRSESESFEAGVAPQARDRFLELCWLLACLRREEAVIRDVTGVVTQPAAGEITRKSVSRGPRDGSRKGSQYREA